MWLLRYSILKLWFFGVFWGAPLACLRRSLANHVSFYYQTNKHKDCNTCKYLQVFSVLLG